MGIVLISCSSNDDSSKNNEELDTEVQISFSGDDVGVSNFNSVELYLGQPCEILELGTIDQLESETITISSFLLQLDNIQQFQENNPGATYFHNGTNANLIAAWAVINSETYIATSLTFDISSEPYQESNCSDYHGQIFNINFTAVLESSNANLAPITITVSTIDLPIIPNSCAC
ncbi:hypothetical protein [Winogradskyella flava]|uniref:Uncharacterized protein n=1 Tax=Winogradskyella flava TaxID=1884876 RepID=A0A842ISE1_9FLAO|nr:hypothetical protein [Winogradskyella flava]MBC2845801.1 hypothetical protein [Winogradskyella flava]